MKITFLVASLTLMTVNAFAVAPLEASYEFNCGKSLNITRTLKVFPKAPGADGLRLGGEYVTAGPDKVTGMISEIKIDMVGQTDLSSELTGKEIAIIALMDPKNPFFQVIVALPSRVGQTVKAAELDLKANEATEFKCKLVSKK